MPPQTPFHFFFFFFNDTATTEIYTLSLHDALPICTTIEVSHEALIREWARLSDWLREARLDIMTQQAIRDRKSTRLNSSHSQISYAVFCLKNKIILLRGPTGT